MLDHFGLVISELNKSVTFFESCLKPLGLQIIERHDYGAVIFAKSKEEEFPFIWIGEARPSFWGDSHDAAKSPMHLCFKAPSKEAVDEFYSQAIEYGGTCNGRPGLRDPGFYAAYVLDPDGNNIEAGWRE